MSYRRDGDIVTIELTATQFNGLLMLLGASAADPRFQRMSLHLANAINVGNPDWTPYAVEDPAKP